MNKKILSWCLFDFANSSYSAVIASVIFPVYYVTHIVGNSGEGDLWWGRAIALSMAFVALSSPFLGGIADYAKIRKRLFVGYSLLCISSVASLYFLQKGMVIEGFVLIVLANIGMEGGLVFYNSFLPEISNITHQGRVSAWGYAIGYAGSIVSLILALFLIKKGFMTLTWPMVALFFGFFSLPAFLFLPQDRPAKVKISQAAINGFNQTWKRLKEIWLNRDQRKFLLAYFIYEDGVNTVIVFSSIFAATTLNFKPEELIAMYLFVQATALIGAFLMAKPIDYWGPKKVVFLSLSLWFFVSFSAFFVQEKIHFFTIASMAGLGLGTIQAASRAFYMQFIPKDKEAEYFGVYALVGKSSAILGPLIFGYLSATFKSQRPAVLSIAFFFLLGLLILQRVKGGAPNV
jgi:UMF1 family MFS transporter